MRVDTARQRQSGRHQERGPVHRMEANDVLADDVDVGGPVFPARGVFVGEAAGGDVVVQRVEPDVHDVVGRTGYRNAPAERCAADRQVAQAASHETHDLVAPGGGHDE